MNSYARTIYLPTEECYERRQILDHFDSLIPKYNIVTGLSMDNNS